VIVILCEHGPGNRQICFDNARELVICRHISDVAPALRWLEVARAEGAWIAGFVSYEAGYALEPRLRRLMPAKCDIPLLAFGIYDGPQAQPAPSKSKSAAVEGAVALDQLEPLISQAQHAEAVARARDYIAAGDCYQVNLTFPMEGHLERGGPLDLYRALQRIQPVGYGAYVDFGLEPVIVSCSPELFFATDSAGRIEARPMKGTAPRHPDPQRDAALAQALGLSVKDRAENLMIVDLLRNDLARISRPGSVRVPELFAVDSFATLHQMSSRISAELAGPLGFDRLIEALFPCGSITGAPKIRAMEIIAELEPFARGAYCGAIGWMAPDGRSSFSVAIRTLSVCGKLVRLNVGGGIVHDSTAEGEWEEALWKASYAQRLTSKAYT
jgi:para-aminobenzoate synthetase component 1